MPRMLGTLMLRRALTYRAAICFHVLMWVLHAKLNMFSRINVITGNMEREERRQVTVILSTEVWKKAKVFAFEHGVTLSQLVENALLRELRGKS